MTELSVRNVPFDSAVHFLARAPTVRLESERAVRADVRFRIRSGLYCWYDSDLTSCLVLQTYGLE